MRLAEALLDPLEQLLRLHPDYLGHWGTVTGRQNYYRLLERADVVLSTALHEFQGVAVMEAVARGCQPLVPEDYVIQSMPDVSPMKWHHMPTLRFDAIFVDLS